MEIQKPLPLLGTVYDELKLLCKATGVPTPTVKWFYKGKSAKENGFFAATGDGQSSMRVFGVTLDKSGVYRCEATNSFGTVFDELNVKIYSRLLFNSYQEVCFITLFFH